MPFGFKLSKRLALTIMTVAAAACGTGTSLGPTQGTLQVFPDTLTIDPKQTVQFSTEDVFQQGAAVPTSVTWSATGGSITSQGLFTADTSVRAYSITARDANGRTASANVKAVHKLQQVILVPATVSAVVGGTLQFQAYGLSRSGDSISVTAAYAATGGTISSSGLYTAGATVGTYRVVAAANNLADTSVVNVGATPPPPGPASVEVTPTGATIDQNASFQFRATVRDAAGNALAGQTVTWSSANAGVATIDASGLAQGTGPGTALISAGSGGKSGSAIVTVTVTAPLAECAAPRAEWLWCDDFEQDRLSRYFEYDAAGGNFSRTAGVGYNGSSGMRAHWDAGQQNAGALHLAIGKEPSSYFRQVDAGTANYREIYWRMYVKNQAGWTGGGGDKLSRAIVFANTGWAEAAIAHVWSGISAGPDGNYLIIDPASGTDASGNLLTTGYNDFAHLNFLGQGHGTTPIFDAAHIGHWYCVEAHARLNSAGNSDGVFELWINGSLETQRTGLNFLGSYADYGINAVYFENYWNAGSVASQERYFDNIVVSTARVGCLS